MPLNMGMLRKRGHAGAARATQLRAGRPECASVAKGQGASFVVVGKIPANRSCGPGKIT